MSRRRRDDSEESLDLLLDTITNAFGGIVFMAILLAVLVQNDTSQPTQAQSSSARLQAIESQRTYQRLVSDLRSARDSTEHLEQRLADVPNDLFVQLETLRELKQEIETLGAAQREVQELEQQLETQATEVVSSSEDLSQQAADLQGDIEELEQRLSQEREKRTTMADLPQLRRTTKLPVSILLRRGRFVEVWESPGNINPSLEQTDLAIPDLTHEGIDYRVGLRSGFAAEDIAAIERLCQRIDGSNYYVAFAIWEDSFAEFRAIQKLLVEHQVEYQLVFMESNATALFGRGQQVLVQ